MDVVNAILKKGADVNVKDFYGDTALILAAKEGQLQVVQAILEHGPLLDETDSEGNTALAQATSHGHLGSADSGLFLL